jgi:hypothetical protein
MFQPEFSRDGCLDATEIIPCGSHAALAAATYWTATRRGSDSGLDPNRYVAKNAQFGVIYGASRVGASRAGAVASLFGNSWVWLWLARQGRAADAAAIRGLECSGVVYDEAAELDLRRAFNYDAFALELRIADRLRTGVAQSGGVLRRALAAKNAKPKFDPKRFRK